MSPDGSRRAQLSLSSPHLHGERGVEIDAGDGALCLFLDGEFYRDRIGIPPELAGLGLRAATLSYGTPADRHRDYVCSDGFADFVVGTVLPALDGRVVCLVGVSLSGLAVAHLALRHPERFPRIVSQSPSAWFDGESIVTSVRSAGGGSGAAWFSVGTRETETDVRHPPSGMHQKVSQIDAVTHLADAWGPSATLRTFDGGHEVEPWAAELGAALTWVMSR